MYYYHLPLSILERQELLGTHNESGIGLSSLSKGSGWIRHPQVKRFIGKEHQLWDYHEKTVREMIRRGYNHNSPIEEPIGKEDYSFPFDKVVFDLVYLEFKRVKRKFENEVRVRGKKVKYSIVEEGKVIYRGKTALLSEVGYIKGLKKKVS